MMGPKEHHFALARTKANLVRRVLTARRAGRAADGADAMAGRAKRHRRRPRRTSMLIALARDDAIPDNAELQRLRATLAK